MTVEIMILLVVFVGLLVLNTPVAVCIGLGAAATIVSLGEASGWLCLGSTHLFWDRELSVASHSFLCLRWRFDGRRWHGPSPHQFRSRVSRSLSRRPSLCEYRDLHAIRIRVGLRDGCRFFGRKFAHSRNGGQRLQARVRRRPHGDVSHDRPAHTA